MNTAPRLGFTASLESEHLRNSSSGNLPTVTEQIIEQRDALEGAPTNIKSIDLLLTDPPYGTGKTQTQQSNAYHDPAEIGATIESIVRWMPAMHPNGTIAIICDYRLAPHITTAIIDNGWSYRGEIIWTFGLGRPRTNWWPVRHNNILTFTRTATSGQFNRNAMPKEPRRALKPGYPSDKPAGSVWDYTMSNTDPERVGYPNQKPLTIIERLVKVHTNAGDLVVDPFLGSGTTAVAAKLNNRNFYGCDINPQAVDITTQRLSKQESDTPRPPAEGVTLCPCCNGAGYRQTDLHNVEQCPFCETETTQ